MKNALIAIGIVAALIGGYFLLRPSAKVKALESVGLGGMNVSELLEELEERTDEPDTLRASVTSAALTILWEGDTHTFEIPEGWFYLSVAPYVENTHPCGTHNLITCRGELKNQTFQVVVTDQEGAILLNETRITHANGFMGLWLPSDIQGTITITYGSLTASGDIATFTTSNTCLTTLQLS